MVKNICLLLLLLCCACASQKPIQFDNKGLSAKISSPSDSVQMNDSIILSVLLENPSNQDIVLDSCLSILLCRYDEVFIMHPPEKIAYQIYQGDKDLIVSANSQYIMDLKFCVSPTFFYYGRNHIYAGIFCSDYYDKQKKIFRRSPNRNRIRVYSNIFDINIRQ